MTLTEGDTNRKNVEAEEAVSKESDNLEAIWSGSQPVLTQEQFVGKLPIFMRNAGYHALGQRLKVLDDVSVHKNPRNDERERMKKRPDPLAEEMNAHKMNTKKLKKTVLGKKITRKAMSWSVVDLERTVNSLETEKRLSTKTNEELFSYSS